jgi:protein O-mannosyl-transferase
MSASTGKNPSSNVNRWQVPAVCLALAAITFAVFGQTLRHGFINYDDDKYVYDNAVVAKGLTLKGILWAFTYGEIGHWHPLTWISHMLDCQFYGLNPGGPHLTNVALHAAAAVLLFLVLREMTGNLWRSAFVAAVFAIHPLRVESVAWIAERKDVLSGVFFMLTLWAYVRYARQPSVSRYVAVALLYGLGLLCKNTLVTLPFVLLLLDWWPLQRLGPRKLPGLVKEKIPLFLLSLGSCVATVLVPEKMIDADRIPLLERIGNAVASYVIYLRQMIYPAGLAIPYPNPPHGVPFWETGLAVVLLAAITISVLVFRKGRPYLLAGWLWYLGMLVPAIGLVQISYYARADRYTYLPQIGIYVAMTWLVADWAGKRLAAGLMTGVIAVLMVCAFIQTGYWKNDETLWNHALACTTGNYIPHYDLGLYFAGKGKLNEAITQYQDALQIEPDNVDALNNLGIALFDSGHVNDAVARYQKALQIKPDYAPAHYNLGKALLQLGKLDEAIAHFQSALQFKTDYAAAHYNLGKALLQMGRADEAIAQFQDALQIDPGAAEVYNNLGNALLQKGKLDEAITQFQQALQIGPGAASPHLNLGIALLQKGRVDEAIAQFQQALQINPNYAAAHYNLGNAFFQKGKTAEAISHFQQALQITPSDAELQNNLAWLLATSADASLRNGKQAVELARLANENTGGENPFILHTLAAAFAEAGQFADAARTVRKAIALARAAGQQDVAAQLNGELNRYEKGLPLRP